MSKFITSRNFPGGTASTTQPGLIQIATQAEVDAGVDCDKAVVPCTLTGFITTVASQATTTTNGTLEIATDPEAIAGVLATHAITPASLAAVLASLGIGVFGANFASSATAGPLLNGTTVFAVADTLVTPVLPAGGTYAYYVAFQMRHTGNNRNVRAQLSETVAGVIESVNEETHGTNALTAHPFAFSGTIALAAGATTFTLEYSRSTFNQPGGASSAEIKGIQMIFFQVA
jgi:hypothetical protein